MHTLTIALLAYNERPGVEGLLQQYRELKRNLHVTQPDLSVELLIVDDASEVSVMSWLSAEAIRDESIHVIRHEKNLGYAKASETALIGSDSEFTIVVDGDGQHPLSQVLDVLPLLQGGADLVLADRFYRSEPKQRLRASRTLVFLAGAIIGFRGPDLNGGIKGCSKTLCRSLSSVTAANLVNPELWAVAKRNGLRISFCPVVQYPRLDGTASRVISAPASLMYKICLYLFAVRRKYEMRR